MATIKATFQVRKSDRSIGKQSLQKPTEKCKANSQEETTHSFSPADLARSHDLEQPTQTPAMQISEKQDATRCALSQLSSPPSKFSALSQQPTSPSYRTQHAMTSKRTSVAVTDDFTRSCLRVLSPTKRKSDDENKFFCEAVSPVKSLRPSPRDSTPATRLYSLSYPCNSPQSSKSLSTLGSPETPKSSLRPCRTSMCVPTSTPRRLFSTPGKEDRGDGNESPCKRDLDVFCSPSRTVHRLSTTLYPRSTGKPYQAAKCSLHIAKPDRLIGRDNEVAEVEDFVCDKLDNGIGASLYISGAPGTGKTAVVNYVVDNLKSKYRGLQVSHINCMMLKDSSAVFQQVYEQLRGSPIKTKDAFRAVETLITSCDENILLVLDEIDQLDNKHHHILYSIFEWPAMKGSKLVLIGIANALDLTDRILPRLQASKTCRPSLMNFCPYTSVQITNILKHRLERDSVVEPSAVNFCARKVSAVAGDVRKALDICRRAVEMVESESRCEQVLKPADCNSPTKNKLSVDLKKVTISHISKVISDVYGSSVSAANSSENDVPLQQKLAVCSLLLLVRNGRLKEVQLGKLHETYTKVCKRQQMMSIDQTEFYSVLSLLDSRGVVMLKKAKDTRLTKVSLKLNEQELEQTLQDKALMAAILKDGIPK